VQVYRGCDLIGIVVDLSGDILDQMEVCLKYLREHRLLLEGDGLHAEEAGQTLGRKALIIATQKDRAEAEAAATLRELYGKTIPMVEISTVTAEGLLDLTRTVFEMLDIVRAYAKRPGHPPDMKEPFTLARGSSVTDLANRIHRELADKLKSARVWNSPVCHDGQNIPREHVVNDKEVIELHFA
jgi:ribosome-interacting GTPase 1